MSECREARARSGKESHRRLQGPGRQGAATRPTAGALPCTHLSCSSAWTSCGSAAARAMSLCAATACRALLAAGGGSGAVRRGAAAVSCRLLAAPRQTLGCACGGVDSSMAPCARAARAVGGKWGVVEGQGNGARRAAGCDYRVDQVVCSRLDGGMTVFYACMGAAVCGAHHTAAVLAPICAPDTIAPCSSNIALVPRSPGASFAAIPMAMSSSAALRAPGGFAAAAQRRQQPRAAVASRAVALAAPQRQLLSALGSGPGSGHRCVLALRTACGRLPKHGPASGAAPAQPPPRRQVRRPAPAACTNVRAVAPSEQP